MHSEGAPDHLPGSLVPDRLEALFDNKIWIGYNLPLKYLVVAYLYFTRWVRLFEVWLVLFIKKIRPQPDFFRFFCGAIVLSTFLLMRQPRLISGKGTPALISDDQIYQNYLSDLFIRFPFSRIHGGCSSRMLQRGSRLQQGRTLLQEPYREQDSSYGSPGWSPE